MASVNKAIILGNLGRDPEIRYASDGSAIANLSIATTRTWKKDGQKQEETEWHRVVLFGRLAEIASEYLAKGRPVYIEGRIRTRKWQDQEGNDRYSTEIFAESMQLLGGGERRERAERPAQRPSPARSAHDFDDMDDDIPFRNPLRGAFTFVV